MSDTTKGIVIGVVAMVIIGVMFYGVYALATGQIQFGRADAATPAPLQAICHGPAILEDGSGIVTIYRIDSGQSRSYDPSIGECFDDEIPSQEFLMFRYAGHVAEYRVKHPNAIAVPEPESSTGNPGSGQPVVTASGQYNPGVASGAMIIGSGSCTKHGTVAWQNDNQLNGALYGEAPIGGLNEPCGVVGQTWTSLEETERFVFYVPPYTVAWISGHRGGTGWYFDPTQDAAADLDRQAQELLERDGSMTTIFAILPGQTFRLVTRIQTVGGVVPSVAPGVATYGTGDHACTGPAILNDGGMGAAFKINDGEERLYTAGTCWPLGSQAILDTAWEDHVVTFKATYPEAEVFKSASGQ